MALLTCPDCGQGVSDQAPVCPHCGRPVELPRNQVIVMPSGKSIRLRATASPKPRPMMQRPNLYPTSRYVSDPRHVTIEHTSKPLKKAGCLAFIVLIVGVGIVGIGGSANAPPLLVFGSITTLIAIVLLIRNAALIWWHHG